MDWLWVIIGIASVVFVLSKRSSKKEEQREAQIVREVAQRRAETLNRENQTLDAAKTTKNIEASEMSDDGVYKTDVGTMTGKQFKDLDRIAKKRHGEGKLETAFPTEVSDGLHLKTTTHDVYWSEAQEWPLTFTKKVMDRTSTLLDLSNKYGCQFQLREDGVSLIYDYFWTNFEKKGVFKSECALDMYFEENFEGWKLSFNFIGFVSVETFHEEDLDAQEYVLLNEQKDDITNFATVKSLLKKMHDTTFEAMSHGSVDTPFKLDEDRTDDFDLFQNEQILQLSFKDGTTDRLAMVGRSVYDWNFVGFPKWICGYSEFYRCEKDFKIKNIAKIMGQLTGAIYYEDAAELEE